MRGLTRRLRAKAGLVLFAALLMVSMNVSAFAKSYSQLKAEHPNWVQVPGKLIRPDCVHMVPNGAQIDFGSDGKPTGDVKLNGRVIAHYNPCPEDAIDTRHLGSHGNPPDPSGYGDGWVEASQWEVGLGANDNIDLMSGNWHVPTPPAENGALIFIFNGIEPTNGGYILQPVLQYGNNGSFGGNYYVVASWLVGPNGSNYVFVSTPQPASPGDLIFGITQQTGVSGPPGDYTLTYFVDGYNESTGQPSAMYINPPAGLHWRWAFAGVLEAYYVTSCSQFPGSGVNHFYDTQVAHGYPSVDYITPQEFGGAFYNYFGSGGPQCNFNVTVSGTTSDLSY